MRSSRRKSARKSNRKSSRKLSRLARGASRGARSAGNNCSRPRGFTMIAHCKAIGKLKRTGKKNKGKYIKSPKYRTTGRRKSSRK
jgi:hypothetical protein